MRQTLPFFGLALLALPLHAQDMASSRQTPELTGDIGPHHKVVRWIERVTAEADTEAAPGQPVEVEHSYTVLSTGMHYWADGEWRESIPEFEESADGFVARRGGHKVILSRTLGTLDAIDLLTPDGIRLRCVPRFLALRDRATGQSVVLGEIRHEIQGELAAPNIVVWRDAFTGTAADVQGVYTTAGFEMDVVLKQQLPPVEQLGLDGGPEDLAIEVWTELAEEVPVEKSARTLPDGSVDEVLRFGEMVMDSGRSFPVGEPQLAVPTAKTLQSVEGRVFLVESTGCPALRPFLEKLPPATGADDLAATLEQQSVEGRARPPGAPETSGALSGSSGALGEVALPSGSRSEVRVGGKPLRLPGDPLPAALAVSWAERAQGFGDRFETKSMLAQTGRDLLVQQGLVLDWTTLQSAGSCTLQSDKTYYVTGSVNLGGKVGGVAQIVTVEGGAVLKYALTNSPTVHILSGTDLQWQAGPYRPVVMTAKDDDSVGEKISGSTGTPIGYYAATALELNGGTDQDGYQVRDFRIAHAQLGILARYHRAGAPHQFRHGQWVKCSAALQLNYGAPEVLNALVYNVSRVFDNMYSATVMVEHLTADSADYLNHGPAQSTLTLHNSLLVDVANTNNAAFDHTAITTSAAGPVFETVGGGAHYLPATSPYRAAGPCTLDELMLDPILFASADTAVLTTLAPTLLSSDLTRSTTLYPRPRGEVFSVDESHVRFPVGYLYWAIDYYWSSREVTNATLTLTNGVVVAHSGSKGTVLKTNGKFVSEGADPLKPNRILRYTAVQEQRDTAEGSPTSFSALWFSAAADVRCRFTEFHFLGESVNRRRVIPADVGFTQGNVRFRDCRFRNAAFSNYNLYSTVPVLEMVNNLFERSSVNIAQGYSGVGHPFGFDFYNNLIRRSSFAVTYFGPYYTAWNIRDNLFDTATSMITYTVPDPYNPPPAPSSNNGFTNSSALLPGTGNKTSLVPVYETPTYGYGEYYYHVDEAAGSFWKSLHDMGSRLPAAAGLAQHTVDASTPANKETGNVDIGFHYPTSLDTDGDALRDWQEDIDGDAVVDSSESSWLDGNADGDGFKDAQERANGTLPGNPDTDNDGVSDSDEYLHGTNPLDNTEKVPPRRLGHWNFNTVSLTNEAGWSYWDKTNVVLTSSFEGQAPIFTNSPTFLRYPCSTNGVKLIDLQHGAVRFWYLPNWYHGNPTDAPGVSCTLLAADAGRWRLSVSADGQYLVFESTNQTRLTSENHRVRLPRVGEAAFTGRTSWEIALSYTRMLSWIEVNGVAQTDPGCALTGFGVEMVVSPGEGFTVGGLSDGSFPAQGTIDELETFGAPVGGTAAGIWIDGGLVFRKQWDPEARRSTMLTASVPEGGGQIDLRWMRGFEGDPALSANNANYGIERRVFGSNTWVNIVTNGCRFDHYSDTTAAAEQTYQYRIRRQNTDENAWPVVVASLDALPRHHRGRALLLMDSTLTDDANVVWAVTNDFAGALRADGWKVVVDWGMPRHTDLGNNLDGVRSVKQRIQTEYSAATLAGEELVVVLLGHVAIPYSGLAVAEDGHEDHKGAWPADLYYGDTDATEADWGDGLSNYPITREPLENRQYDGKWDANRLPTTAGGQKLEIAVGRIDFANMPAFVGVTWFPVGTPHADAAQVERALLRNYVTKNLAYRNKTSDYQPTQHWRLFVGGGAVQELLDSAQSAAMSFDGSPFDDYRILDDVFITREDYGSDLFRWGIHGALGSYNSIDIKNGGERLSDQLVEEAYQPNVLFYILRGSYLVDWNCGWQVTDGFMRACLSTRRYGLLAMWAGASNPAAGPWRLNRLGIGAHMGAMLQDTVASTATQSSRAVYLLGDPTLCAYVLAPPGTMTRTPPLTGTNVNLSWTASPDAEGYYVYRGADLESALQQPPTLVTSLSFQTNAPAGTYSYAVRAVKKLHSGAGSFRHLSRASTVQVQVIP